MLPVPLGQKAPIRKGWQNATLSEMDDSSYLQTLNGGNIGVLLGKPSGGLCSIDLDNDQEVEEFLLLNPRLSGTLQTRGSRGRNFWVRIDGDYPSLTTITDTEGEAWGEWRSTGGHTVMWGLHPNGKRYEFMEEAQPINLRFDEIVWPDKLRLGWVKTPYDLLVEKEGEIVHQGNSGAVQLNHSAFAEKFVIENRMVYEPEEDEFYRYDQTSGIYEPLSPKELSNELSHALKKMSDEAAIPKLAFHRGPAVMNSISDLMKGKLSKEGRNAFKKKSSIIHVQNGVLELDLDGGLLWEFHPEFVSRTKIPVTFNPNAACPRFLNEFLRPVLPEEDIFLLQTYLGSTLLGVNESQKILIMDGAAGSGKSTLLNVLELIIGGGNVYELRLEHLNGRFELYPMRSAVLLAGKDVRSDFLNNRNAGILKKLTGGDSVTCEKKGGTSFSVPGVFHVVITSNGKLQVALDGDREAWERRLAGISFTSPGARKMIPGFAKLLVAEEGSGILNFFLEGAMRSLNEGVSLSPTQEIRMRNLLRQSDSVRVFAEEGVRVKYGEDIESQQLYNGYMDFCEAQGWECKSAQTFAQDVAPFLESLYSVNKSTHVNGRRGYKNLQLKG